MIALLALTLLAQSPVAGPPADEWEVPLDSAMSLHATALSHEIDGEIDQALALLRSASALAPNDPMIAWDLARIAYQSNSPSLAADAARYLALDPQSEDERVLRAYVLMRLGERQAAREQLDAVLAGSPAHGEASRLRDVMGLAGELPGDADWFFARLRVRGEFDSNVSVIPEVEKRRSGGRLGVDGSISLVPLRDPVELTLGVSFDYAPHLNDRDNDPDGAGRGLSLYDAATGAALVRARADVGPLVVTASVSGSEVLIDSFAEHFLQELFADLEVRYPLGVVQLGVFGRGGYRDFGGNFNPEQPPTTDPEDPPSPDLGVNDRDGPRVSAGARFDWADGAFGAGTQVSFEGAFTDGELQEELGLLAGGYVRWRSAPWMLRLGVSYALRTFPYTDVAGADPAPDRVDNLLSASLSLSVALHEHFGLFASVLGILNESNLKLDYERIVATGGVSTQW